MGMETGISLKASKRVIRLIGVALSIIPAVTSSFGEARYSGTLGKIPIELFMGNAASDNGYTNAVYMYLKYNTPITLSGSLQKGTLSLFEKGGGGKKTAELSFPNYKADGENLEGIWKSLTNNRKLPINLKLECKIAEDTMEDWSGREVLQAASLKNIFFRIVTSQKAAGEEPYSSAAIIVSGINLYEKKTGKLFQSFDVGCGYFNGMNAVTVDDYNFDGIDDFSILEEKYAGSNTSSLYFLCDTSTGRYFDSGFEGISLEFMKESKVVVETNISGGGRDFQSAVYAIENNKMVLIEKTSSDSGER